MISDLPLVEAHSSSFYTPPYLNMKFPELLRSAAADTKLHLAGACQGSSTLWSQAIDLDFEHSIFVRIPEVFDVRVSSAKLGHTLRVSIDPVNRAEVSAKEIRSRIKSRGSSQARETRVIKSTASNVEVKKVEPQRNKSMLTAKSPVRLAEFHSDENDLQLTISCFCHRADIVLLDEQSCVTSVQEFMSMTLESVGVMFYPVMDVPHSTMDHIRHLQHVRLCARNFQVDNLMYGKASYDFPVVMRAKADGSGMLADELQPSFRRTLRETVDRLSAHSLINVHVELFTGDHGSIVQAVNVAIKPTIICIEDVYVSNLLKLIVSLIPRSNKASQSVAARRFPSRVSSVADSLCCPVCLQRLCIEKVDLMLSVHASLKLYVASDDAPLSLGRFEQTCLCTTAHQLMRVITMHYATCALYRAGNNPRFTLCNVLAFRHSCRFCHCLQFCLRFLQACWLGHWKFSATQQDWCGALVLALLICSPCHTEVCQEVPASSWMAFAEEPARYSGICLQVL